MNASPAAPRAEPPLLPGAKPGDSKPSAVNLDYYVPTALRTRATAAPRKAAFAIASEQKPGEYGFVTAPAADVGELLETVPNDPNACIVRMNENHTETIVWQWQPGRWLKRA